MKNKVTGGARFRKEQMNKRFKMLAYFGLTVIAFIIFGTASGDVLTGLGFATMLPIGFEGKTLARGLGKGDPEPEPDPTEVIKQINADYKAKHQELKDLVGKAAKQEDIDKVKSDLKELTEKRIQASEDLVKKQGDIIMKQGESITSMQNQIKSWQKSEKGRASLKAALLEAFKEKQSEIDELVKDPTGQQKSLTLKVAVDMGEQNTIGSGSTQVSMTQNTGVFLL